MADLLKFSLLLSCFTLPLKGEEFGKRGTTFPIQEEDVVHYIKNQILNFNLSEGKINPYPRPVEGIEWAESSSTHYYDPTVVCKEDLHNSDGKLLVAKGSSHNPLESRSLTQDLLFFDGNCKEQIEWARSFGSQTKWILIDGNPFELEKEENRPVYFDQCGEITSRLSIAAVPARVSQEGKRLKIETTSLLEILCGL